MSDAPILSIKNLMVEFPRAAKAPLVVIDHVSLDIQPGRVMGLVGESGSGKTMMALSAMGLIPSPGRALAGSVVLNGVDLLKKTEAELRKIRGRDVGIVFQDPLSSLNPVRPVGSLLIQSAMQHAKCSRTEATERAIEMLNAVGIVNARERIRSYPHEFSGGQRQRIMIALAAMNAPPLIVADEPTTALDATIQQQVLDLLKRGIGQKALFLITHDLRVAAEVCDHISVMRQGKIVESGAADEILACPQEKYTKKLIEAVPKFGHRELFISTKKEPTPCKPLLEMKDVEVSFKSGGRNFKALDRVSLMIRAGGSLGIVGESGSGKSTIAKSIMRIVNITSGQILIDGVDCKKVSGNQLRTLKRRVQMVFQDPYASLDPRWRVGRIVAEPLRAQGQESKDKIETRVAKLIEQVELPADTAQRFPVQFSGGQRQRICLARALTLTPELLIADEPVSSLDVTIQWKIAKLLKKVQQQYNLALILVAHDLPLVYQLTERIVVLYLGQIVEMGDTVGVLMQPQHPYTAALLFSSGKRISKEGALVSMDFGEPGSIFDPPVGCRFHPRCPISRPRCKTEIPSLRSLGNKGSVACHFPGELKIEEK